MKRRSRPIRSRISDGGRDQFSGAEREDRQERDAEVARRAHGAPQRLDAAPVPFAARQAARRGPAPVAIHDDGDVPRHGESVDLRTMAAASRLLDRAAVAQTVMISFSLPASSLSTSAIACVGRLLHLAPTDARAIVLADLVILLQLLEHVEAVAAHVAHRDLRGLGVFVRDLDEFACAAPR